MVFQFEHVEGDGKYGKWTDEKLPLTTLKDTLSRWQTELYGTAWNSLFWNNHDQPRAVSRFGDDRPQYREASAKMLATCLHMLQGTPYIYQGEELGMTNSEISKASTPIRNGASMACCPMRYSGPVLPLKAGTMPEPRCSGTTLPREASPPARPGFP